MCFPKAYEGELVKLASERTCYTTNKPLYSPSPQAGSSEQRISQRRPKGGGRVNGVKTWRHKISYGIEHCSLVFVCQGQWVYFEHWFGRAVERSIRWLQRFEASLEGVEARSQACGYPCYLWGLLQWTSPWREPSCANPAVQRSRTSSRWKDLWASRFPLGLLLKVIILTVSS